MSDTNATVLTGPDGPVFFMLLQYIARLNIELNTGMTSRQNTFSMAQQAFKGLPVQATKQSRKGKEALLHELVLRRDLAKQYKSENFHPDDIVKVILEGK